MILNKEGVEKKRPGRPSKDTKNTEHILVSADVKKGLEFLRRVYKKDSYGDVVLKLFQLHLLTFRSVHFLKELAILNIKESETIAQSLDRMLKYRPRKIKLYPTTLWPDGTDVDMKVLEDFIDNGSYK